MTAPKNIRYNPSNKRIIFVDPISTEPFREVSPKKNNKKSGRKPLLPDSPPPETSGTPIGLLLLLTR